MTPPKKVSAAAARRLRDQVLAQQSDEPLPQEFLTYVESGYAPRPALQPTWTQVRPLVLESLRRSQVRGMESLKKHVTHLAHFWTWVLQQRLPLDVDQSLTRPVVDDYAARGMAGSSRKSCTDRRSRLRSIADAIHPDNAPGKAVTFPRQALRPPYTEAEMATIRRVAQVQPTGEIRRQMSLCVGLGAGAGIDSADLKRLHRNHVCDGGTDGITVTVPATPAREAREVTVLREYEHLVREGIAGLSDNALLLGKVKTRHNVAAAVFERATLLGNVPHLEQSRLRSTWLTTLMSRPIPLAVILNAAGLRSARTIVELLPYAVVGADDAALRDGGAR